MNKPRIFNPTVLTSIQTVVSGVVLALLISIASTYSKVEANTSDIKDIKRVLSSISELNLNINNIAQSVAINKADLEWIKNDMKTRGR